MALLLAACSAPQQIEPVPPAPEVRISPQLTTHGIAWSELGDGEPILLLNGTGSPMAEWDPGFLSALARERRVIVFDYPGLGDSTAPAGRTFTGIAAATAEFMADIDVPRADVLGWSMGGFVAQELLRRQPDRVDRAVLVGTNPGGDRTVLGPRWVQRADSDPDAGVKTYLRTNYPPTTCAQRRGRAFLRRLNQAVASGRYPDPIVPARTYNRMVAAEDPWLRSNRNASALQSVQVPVLVMVGRRDVITPPANGRALADLLPEATLLEVPAAGHSVLFQAPRESVQAISAFLDAETLPASLWPCT